MDRCEEGTAVYERLRARHVEDAGAHLAEHCERTTWDRERLDGERVRRLLSLVRFAQRRSPWHRERLAALDPERIDVEDLGRIPPMTKVDLMADFDRAVATGGPGFQSATTTAAATRTARSGASSHNWSPSGTSSRSRRRPPELGGPGGFPLRGAAAPRSAGGCRRSFARRTPAAGARSRESPSTRCSVRAPPSGGRWRRARPASGGSAAQRSRR